MARTPILVTQGGVSTFGSPSQDVGGIVLICLSYLLLYTSHTTCMYNPPPPPIFPTAPTEQLGRSVMIDWGTTGK